MRFVVLFLVLTSCGKNQPTEDKAAEPTLPVPDPYYYVGTWVPQEYCEAGGMICGAGYAADCQANVNHEWEDHNGVELSWGTYVIEFGGAVSTGPSADNTYTWNTNMIGVVYGWRVGVYQYGWTKMNESTVLIHYSNVCTVKLVKQ